MWKLHVAVRSGQVPPPLHQTDPPFETAAVIIHAGVVEYRNASRSTTEEIPMHVKALSGKRPPAVLRKQAKRVPRAAKKLTIRDLGWTRERAREVRARLATFAMDWDDPRMDIYNEP
jgi:hypothetical protein